jgi:cystathionine beta-synthase
LNDKADNGVFYVIEGIGYDFVPQVLSRGPETVDHWVKTSDAEAYAAVKLLMRQEGLLVGGSSGSSLSGALNWLKSDAGKKIAETEGLNVVVLLPDGYVSLCWLGLGPGMLGGSTIFSL